MAAVGEQPLSFVEFITLRCYSGPLFVKYNNVLRAAIIPDFQQFLDEVCQRNRYTTTIHVLAAAIVKLSRLTGAPRNVYRAPGGALPDDFWRRTRNGTVGIIEAGCLSTSTEKEEALHYARAGSAKLLFEVQQGFVGRGASISWLSQFPSEQEILFPPCCAFEVLGSRIEEEMVIVTCQPTMLPPEGIRSGADDVYAMNKRIQEEKLAKERAIKGGGEAQRSIKLWNRANNEDGAAAACVNGVEESCLEAQIAAHEGSSRMSIA